MPKKSLLIIAPQGFQDIELNGTRKGLQEANFEVVLASTEAGECTGKFGAKEQAALALRDVKVEDYDRIAYIGGPGAHKLPDDPDAVRIARETVAAKKPLGAICIAPLVLGRAGVLQGIEATVWNEDGLQGPILENDGAIYTGEPIVVDGLIVTGEGPQVAEEFGKTFAALG
jgi:protease I